MFKLRRARNLLAFMAFSIANPAAHCSEPARSTWRGLVTGVALALFVLATMTAADAQAGNRDRSARAAKSGIHKGDRKTASASSLTAQAHRLQSCGDPCKIE